MKVRVLPRRDWPPVFLKKADLALALSLHMLTTSPPFIHRLSKHLQAATIAENVWT